MTPKHAPEPWRTGWRQGHRVFVEHEDGDEVVTDLIARVGLEANAARIVSCVNALAGKDPEALGELVRAADQLQHQFFIAYSGTRVPREVKDALKAVLSALSRFSPEPLRSEGGVS